MAPMRTTAKARKNSPKTAKLEAFLLDFDSEVKTRVDQEKEKLNNLLEDVDHGYKMALYKIAKPIRKMPWMEQFKSESPELANVSWLAANQQTQQPYSYLMETVRQRDTQINALKERLSSLQDEVSSLREERTALQQVNNNMAADLERLLNHREVRRLRPVDQKSHNARQRLHQLTHQPAVRLITAEDPYALDRSA